MKKQVTIVRRKKKIEAVRAMTELVERGYEVIEPLTQRFKEGNDFERKYQNQRLRYSGQSVSSCWYAKLARVSEE